jgi:hypothetical protein
MRDRRRPLLVAMVLALALVIPAAASARVPQGFAGMVVGDPLFPSNHSSLDLAHQLDTMVASGVESVRAVFNWSYAQPYKSWSEVPAGQAASFTDVGGVPTRFDQMDQLVGLAAQRRLSVLPVVLYAPWWDSAPHPRTSYAQPATDAPYAKFVGALVQRYGPHGSFWLTHSPKVPIRMWQIWNEPNITVFWPKQPFERSYLALLRSARQAIKRFDPGAKIVFAGMPNYSWQRLAQVYRYRGSRKLFDVVAIHPYTRQPAGVIQILSRVRSVMNAHGDRRKPILADEISWPSSLGQTRHTEGFDFATTPSGQARNLATLLPMLARDRARLGLLGFYYYTWAGVEIRNGLAFDFAGLFRLKANRFIAKPAFYAFRHAALTIEGCRRKGSVATACLKRG